jgi:predicted lipid-binding transport protein (Tim44 family)
VLNRLRRLKSAAPWRRARAAQREARARQLQVDELLRLARLSFMRLQLAWDTADLRALGELATRQLLDELRDQLAQRGPGSNHTEVLQLQARLLSLDDLHEAMLASVEFTGLIREHQAHEAAPFRELWMLASVKAAGPGWKLARVQSLS